MPPEWNRLDARDLAYHQRVAAGFHELMQREPERWRKLDARRPIDDLAQAIESEVRLWLPRVARLPGNVEV